MVIHKAQAIGGAVARAFALLNGTNNRTHRRAKFRMGLLLILTLAAFNSLLAQDVRLCRPAKVGVGVWACRF
jgi:hypothetical protein